MGVTLTADETGGGTKALVGTASEEKVFLTNGAKLTFKGLAAGTSAIAIDELTAEGGSEVTLSRTAAATNGTAHDATSAGIATISLKGSTVVLPYNVNTAGNPVTVTAGLPYPTFIAADADSTIFHTNATGFNVAANQSFDKPMKAKFDNEFKVTGAGADITLTLASANVEFDKFTSVLNTSYKGLLVTTVNSPSKLTVTGKLTLLDNISLADTTAEIASLTTPGNITLTGSSTVTLSGLAEFTHLSAASIGVPITAKFLGKGDKARVFGKAACAVTFTGASLDHLKTFVAVPENHTAATYDLTAGQSSLWNDTTKKWGLSE